ncbi:B3 domain-containing protein At5g18000-like [Actinidia eriantha]|uniref:B3 domain-containing protein At5g18000-like n=1 Tax=Actinidia eriantha TaxID=165200 RepID=UPI002584A0A0|nr:B3 domain-containing protein At5g18000-like [Actinidia eriantha]
MVKQREKKKKQMKSNMVTDKRPCFFKIIVPDHNAEQLRIPPHFVMQHIANDASNRAVLRGPFGGCWDVELSKNVKSGMFLGDGWQRFVEAHSLGNNEFLLFTYNGNMCFNVRIFEQNGLERVK